MCVYIHSIFTVGVGKWDDTLPITHLSGVASTLFFAVDSPNMT